MTSSAAASDTPAPAFPETLVVLGAGAWGLTLAALAQRQRHANRPAEVRVWTRDAAMAERLRRDRERGRPAGLHLDPEILVTSDLAAALAGATMVVLAVSSPGLRGIMGDLVTHLPADWWQHGVVVCASKGLEQDTGLLPSQLFTQVIGAEAERAFVALGGPSHAEEVCRGDIPTAAVAAGSDPQSVARVRQVFHQKFYRVYPMGDAAGVELGGALKNIIAIAAGMCYGLGFGDNTCAAIVARGVREMTRAAVAFDANPNTLVGIGGLGDLVVTATSLHSRNRKFGLLLGAGLPVADALQDVGQVVEGYFACRAMYRIAEAKGIRMPLTKLVYSVVHGGVALRVAVEKLLESEPPLEDL